MQSSSPFLSVSARAKRSGPRPTGFAARTLASAAVAVIVSLSSGAGSAAAQSGHPMAGYWKLRGSTTSAVFHVWKVESRMPAQWGWTPNLLGRVWRPGGCYRRVPMGVWVVGFAGGGAFWRFLPGSGCRPAGPTTTRWFVRNGGRNLQQNYIVDPDGIRGPAPGRQVRLWWQRTQPAITLLPPVYAASTRRMTLRWRLEAVYGVRVELRRDNRVVYTRANLPWRDGPYTLVVPASLPADKYEVRLSARSGPVVRLNRALAFTAS